MPERVQANLRVLVEVAFAQFQEPATVSDASQAACHRFACQGIQDHVYAVAVSGFHDVVKELKIARVHHSLYFKLVNQRPFGFGSGSRKDLCVLHASDVHRGATDSTRCRMNQQRLAVLQAADSLQRIQHGDVRDGHGDGGSKVQAVRNSHDAFLFNGQHRTETTDRTGQHAIADLEVRNIIANRTHDPRAFVASG